MILHLKYFGTAAAEGVPGMFCTCGVCEDSRRLGGRNIRTRSQALVDGRLLIDFPPDTYYHCLAGGLDLPSITACVLTHSHQDHLYAGDFENRKPGFAYSGAENAPLAAPLRIYATSKAMEAVRAVDKDRLEARGVIEPHEIVPCESFQVDDFTVTALPADHSAASGPVIYCIARGGKTMLYANDTGWFPDAAWAYLEKSNIKFDYISLDCTGMVREDYRRGHMALPANAEVRTRLLALGLADERTLFCCHHFSHNGGLTHDAFVPLAAREGFLASYDGMEVSF